MSDATALVLASSNQGKLIELDALLKPLGFKIYPLARFTTRSVEETGATFRDNALLKARYAAEVAGMAAIADDSGLEVDALGGAPGILSARYAGTNASDEANNQKLLEALHGVPDDKRSARFRCVLAYVRGEHDDQPLIAEGFWEGRILDAPRGAGGFGYDPLFLPTGSKLSSAELTREEKNRLSHRAQALKSLLDLLRRQNSHTS